MKKALELEPLNFKVLFNMAVILKKLGNLEEAEDYYIISIQQNPHFPYSYFNLAILYKERGEYEKGLDVLNEAIHYNKNVAVLYYNRGCLYALMELKEKALRDLIRATEIDADLIEYMKEDEELNRIRHLEAYKKLFEN